MKRTAIASSLTLLMPLIASAQQLQPIRNFVIAVGGLVNAIIPILIGIAVIVFFWGLIKYIREPGKAGETGKATMVAGLVALFVMVSLWGIIILAGSALGVGSNSASSNQISTPQIPNH